MLRAAMAARDRCARGLLSSMTCVTVAGRPRNRQAFASGVIRTSRPCTHQSLIQSHVSTQALHTSKFESNSCELLLSDRNPILGMSKANRLSCYLRQGTCLPFVLMRARSGCAWRNSPIYRCQFITPYIW